MILTDDALLRIYGHMARELERFVQDEVVEKLLGVRRSTTWFRTRGTLSPSLRYMNTLYGKLDLIGHLARNRRSDGQSVNPDGPKE